MQFGKKPASALPRIIPRQVLPPKRMQQHALTPIEQVFYAGDMHRGMAGLGAIVVQKPSQPLPVVNAAAKIKVK